MSTPCCAPVGETPLTALQVFDKLLLSCPAVNEVLAYYCVIAVCATDDCVTLNISLPEDTEVSGARRIAIAREIVKELRTLLNTGVRMIVEYTVEQRINIHF